MTIYGGDYSNSFCNKVPTEREGTKEQQSIVYEMLPLGFISRGTFDDRKEQHIEWTKQSQYNNTFVHSQYHSIVFNGETYSIHQQQYYNHNYQDFRSPGYTSIVVIRNVDGKEVERLGYYLMNTKEYLKDIQNLNVKERVS